ncbi:MAG: phBC6A51 family helix-turn-helix protein [Clostridiaceae bacterium]|nr:phBC6A51 family helix-turn-helix protein [Clostridiaceae bacterium]
MEKTLTDKQKQAIEMLCTGDYTKQEVADFVQVDRTTIYNWLNNERFMAELEKGLQQIKSQANKEFTSRLPRAIEEYWKICTSSTDVRTKEKALANWIERSLGRIANTININDPCNEAEVDLLEEFYSSQKTEENDMD